MLVPGPHFEEQGPKCFATLTTRACSLRLLDRTLCSPAFFTWPIYALELSYGVTVKSCEVSFGAFPVEEMLIFYSEYLWGCARRPGIDGGNFQVTVKINHGWILWVMHFGIMGEAEARRNLNDAKYAWYLLYTFAERRRRWRERVHNRRKEGRGKGQTQVREAVCFRSYRRASFSQFLACFLCASVSSFAEWRWHQHLHMTTCPTVGAELC